MYTQDCHIEYHVPEKVMFACRLIIRPRVMVNVKNIDLSTSILGQPIKTPICIAPTSNHRLAHPEGEKATVRGT